MAMVHYGCVNLWKESFDERKPIGEQDDCQDETPDPETHEQETTEQETLEQYWQRSLGNHAGDAIAMEALWTKEFGDWEKFKAPSDLVTLAKQAAKAWADLAAKLERKKQST
jgi:hypothetical protein